MEQTKGRRRSQKGANRILVLEGEELTRQFTQRALGALGYSVSSVAGTAEVIGFYRLALERGKPFRAVILTLESCDDLDGLETFEQLRLLDPDVRVVVSTADPDDPLVKDHRRYGFHNCLVKPFGEAELAAVLEDRR